jgi:gamma-glutamyltranspeptidase/glutathione hydrolase
MRCVYADRRVTVGDPAHVHVPLEGLLDSRYLAERCRAFDPARAQERWEPGNPWQFEPTWTASSERPTPRVGLEGQGQTTHFTVADRWGNVVAATATIESLFGSGIMVPGLGLLLNNQMSDFNEYPSGPNQVRPGARPLSSMAPTMVMRGGKPILTLGSPGGATIVPSILQVLTRVVDDGQPLEDAVAAPRLYAGEGRRVTWEDGIDERLCTGLTERGHEISREPRSIGNVQAIMIDWSTGTLTAAADPRRQGAVVVDGEV